MTIKFLYSRRESLTGKSEAYKKAIRAYLESLGFSQTTDSFVEGTFEDMLFYNPTIAPGREFVVEAKAENLSLKNDKFARELVKHFRLWRSQKPERRFTFMLFVQGIKDEARMWEQMFSKTSNVSVVYSWCTWYNDKCANGTEPRLQNEEILDMNRFLSETEVTVGNRIDLETATCEKESTSVVSVSRMATKLLKIASKRRVPIMSRSLLVMNILPITVPDHYYICESTVENKRELYDALKGELIPPFIWRTSRSMMSFAEFDGDNPLSRFSRSSAVEMKTKELQIENPTLSSSLVNIHMRRIIWNRGIYRDGEIFYLPLLDKSKDMRLELGPDGRKRWVTKKLLHKEDTKYAKKGDINFYFHRAVELRTPTYWESSYIELTPRKYYTLDGETPIEGDIRKKMDARFRNPTYDRSKTRIGLMKFWKYVLFESEKWVYPPEKWFDKFHFGNYLTDPVEWSPKVIGRDQTRLWDFEGAKNA